MANKNITSKLMFKIVALLQIIGVLDVAHGNYFDSFISYRQGNNAMNADTAYLQYDGEPDVPGSVDEIFAHTQQNPENDTIDVVHCYSMQNSLYGRAKEARVFWSRLDFSNSNYHSFGDAENIHAVSFSIETKIEQFAVHEEDLTVFLMGQSQSGQVILHIVPGPSVYQRSMRTFTFWPDVSHLTFSISEMLVLPQAEKIIFFSEDHLGEISLKNYPFQQETENDDMNPTISIHKVHGVKNGEGANPDQSSSTALLQIQPVYVGSQSTDQLFVLATNQFKEEMALRIDVISAQNPLKSAINIARINTNAHSAYNFAKFAEIAQQSPQDTERRHFFATMAYQIYGTEANYLAISEARFKDGVWQDDRSQSFFVLQSELDNTYLHVLGIKKNREPQFSSSKQDIFEFTVYLTGSKNFYKADFAVTNHNGPSPAKGFELKRADLYKSLQIDFNPRVTRISFFPEHNLHKHVLWPDYYLFLTTTNAWVDMIGNKQLRQNEDLRVQDGLMISEFFFKKHDLLTMMQEPVNKLDKFSKEGSLVEDMIYSDSRILQPGNTIYGDVMKSSEDYLLNEQSLFMFGTKWIDTLEVCAMPETDYSQLVNFGVSNQQVVSYLDTDLSSKSNMKENELNLAKYNHTHALKLFNEVNYLATESYNNRCDGDVVCAAHFSLCFRESSEILLCDENDEATNEVFELKEEQIDMELDDKLIGQPFYLEPRENDMCYISTPILKRCDENQSMNLDPAVSKRIYALNPGEPPALLDTPPSHFYLDAGKYLEIPFSDFADPEENTVFFKIKLRRASKFAIFDYDQNKIIIEKGMTSLDHDAGEYPITAELVEYVKGIQMPPRTYEFILTVGGKRPPPPPPPPETSTAMPPKPKILSFMMNGRMQIFISKSISFPPDLMNRFNNITSTRESVYGEDYETAYIRRLLQIKLIPGAFTDETKLGFKYQITSLSSGSIEVKFEFDNPLEISQTADPEKVEVVFNMNKYKDGDGRGIPEGLTLNYMVPRQIPSEAEAATIESSGENAEGAAAGAGVGNFIVTLILAASLNQLWSMLNGLQLAVHMPLFYCTFPSNANFFITFIISVATFDMLPPMVIPTIFDFPAKDSFNLAFQATGYASMYSIENLGTCYMLINVYICQVVIWFLTGCCKDSSKCAAKWHHKYDKTLFWGSIIRLLFEGYLETCCSVFVSLTDMVWEKNDYSVINNNIFTIVLCTALFGLPIFIKFFYHCHIDSMEDEEFVEKYGDIYDGLVLDQSKEKRQIALFYPFWFVMRRLLFALTCIYFEKDLWLQMAINFSTGLVNLGYLIRYRPFDDQRVNNLEIMNEFTNFVMLYHVMCFTDFVPEAEDRYYIGWSFVACIVMNLLVHLTLLIMDTVAQIKESCKEKCCKKKKTEEEEELEKKELSVIFEEDEFQSNHSDKESHVRKRDEKLSDSDWESKRLGGTQYGGYNLAEIQWTDLGRKYMIKRGGKTNQVDYDDSKNQQVCHTIADDMSSARPIMQNELLEMCTRLPLALTKRKSEMLVGYGHDKEEEDKSEESSELGIKSQLVNYRKQQTGLIDQPDVFKLTQDEHDTPKSEGDLTNDPDVVMQTLPENGDGVNETALVTPMGGEIVKAKMKNLGQVKRYQVDEEEHYAENIVVNLNLIAGDKEGR